MAAVTKVRPTQVSPVGYEVVDTGVANEAIGRGDAVIRNATGWSKAPVNTTDPHGLAMQDYYLGQGGCDFLIQGEMDGYSGLTPGDPIHVSGTVAGGLDTTPPASAVTRMRATTATRIRINAV